MGAFKSRKETFTITNLCRTPGVPLSMRRLWWGLASVGLAAVSLAGGASPTPGPRTPQSPYRVLIVGGGPDPSHNQVAIESNVRYVSKLVPAGSPTRILFTDGDPQSKNVLYADENDKAFFRAPQLAHIDGPASLEQIRKEIANISFDVAAHPTEPVLLYFTGHGSPNYPSQYNNNNFDLWDDGHLTVKQLGEALASFPKKTPITLVMVECFSGAFGNLLFKDADAKGELADLNVCGFFASVAQRMAAGCTTEVNERNYRDFTSYFFSALTGTDRLGNHVSGADYNHDGKVGMNEAFCYSLIHDESIDTPVCTSDVFLRRYVTLSDDQVMSTPFSSARGWASPAQRAALDALSDATGFTGEDALKRAYDFFSGMRLNSDDPKEVKTLRFVRLAKSVVLGHQLMTSADETLKARYAALLKLESANPLR